MDLFLSIYDFIVHSESGVLAAIAIIFVGIAVAMCVAVYGKKVMYYVLHKRNRWYFVLFFLYAAVIFFSSHYHILPRWWLFLLMAGDCIYGLLCIITIKYPVGYASYILKKYKRELELGLISENISFFEKDHWYISEITEKIAYARLKACYYSAIGNKKKALDCISGISEDLLYEEEITEITVEKAMMLWELGAFSTACELIDGEKYDEVPMVWIVRSLVMENRGDLNQAYEYVLKAKSLCESGKGDIEDKISMYSNFGRIQLMRGNRMEAVKYFNAAYNILKEMKHVRMEMLHVIMENLIINKTIMEGGGVSIERIIDDYRELITKESISNFIEFNNCLIGYYRQIGDSEKVFQCIREGYFELVHKLDVGAEALFQASTFRMIMNGRFVYDWFDGEVEKSYKSYGSLPLLTKIAVYREYYGIFQQEEFRYIKYQSPYKELNGQIAQYYKAAALSEINEALAKLDAREIHMYYKLMLDKLYILKFIEKENHIQNSQALYLDIYKTLNDAGMRIDAIHVFMILVDECSSAYNVKIQLNPFMSPIIYQDYIDMLPIPPRPEMLQNGIQLKYYRLNFSIPIHVIPQYEQVIEEKLGVIMPEVRKWQNHPAKWEQSLHIAHLLMCLNRREEAKEFYGYFKAGKMAVGQYSAWFQDECRLLEAEFEHSTKFHPSAN